MIATGTKGFQVLTGRPPAASLFAAKWNSLVQQWVHAPTAASQPGLGNVITKAPGTPGPNLGNVIANAPGPRRLGVMRGPALPLLTPTLTDLWVEKGVIWQLPNLLVGFTSYSAATTFFSSVASFKYQPAPSSWYEGSPFSAKDFPMLHWGTKGIEINGFILVWPSLAAMSFAPTFLPMIPVNQPLIPSPCPSAGPVASTSVMGNFSADSPSGVQTFQAKYVMYAPFGPNPLSGLVTSASGIQYDMILYSWWYNF